VRVAPGSAHGPTATAAAAAAAQVRALGGHTDRALFALVDLHPYLGDPGLVRALRDLQPLLEQRGQTVVFVSPTLEVPDELGDTVVVFELPLPGPGELAELLEAAAGAVGATPDAETRARAVRAVQGLTALAATRAFRRALAAPGGLVAGAVGDLIAEKRRVLRRTDLLEFFDSPPQLSAVGGLDSLKEWLVEREAAFDERARAFGLPTPKGLLLVGVQGCGKSLTAKAIARVWNLPLARLDFGALFTFGRSPEQNLRRVFRLSEALAPVILWVDEIDKVFKTVSSDSGGSEALSRVFAAFITWMQEKSAPVFVVATANAVDHLPAELLRKGRFDDIFFVDLPSRQERAGILGIHLAAHGRDPAAFPIEALADQCQHFSGAELEQVIIAGLYRAFQRNRELTAEDLAVAAKGIVPLYRTAEEQIKRLRDWAKQRARRASPDAHLAELWGQAGKG
jgi:MoxR-like ATPase